jgi:hypothetical protein
MTYCEKCGTENLDDSSFVKNVVILIILWNLENF